MSNIVLFGDRKHALDQTTLDFVGSRGVRAVSLVDLDVPICPGFVIPNDVLETFDGTSSAWAVLKEPVGAVERGMGRHFASSNDHPLLLKATESPMLNVSSALPSIHHLGLCESTIDQVATAAGEKFAYREYAYMIASIIRLELSTGVDEQRRAALQAFVDDLQAPKTKAAVLKVFDKHKGVLQEEIFTEPFFQLSYVLKLFQAAFAMSPTSEDSAVLVQAMVYGNIGDGSSSGYLYTHNIISGADELQGEFFPQAFDEHSVKGKSLSGLPQEHLDALRTLARTLEDHFRELRYVRFTIEHEKLWLIEQSAVSNKSTQAEIKTLLDLMRRGVVSQEYVINAIKPGRLAEILHPTLDPSSVAKFETIRGGIAGSVGAAIGRVYFSTDRLIDAHRAAQIQGEDTDVILAMTATFAGDVKGIEIAQGVLSSEGGYASHAPVVARSLGKVALVRSDITFKAKSMTDRRPSDQRG